MQVPPQAGVKLETSSFFGGGFLFDFVEANMYLILNVSKGWQKCLRLLAQQKIPQEAVGYGFNKSRPSSLKAA
jgi:hypothetical protein